MMSVGSHNASWMAKEGKDEFFKLFCDPMSTCCPWSHGLRSKKFLDSVAMLPLPVRVPSQRPVAPILASVTSVANDKIENETIPRAVHRSPGISLKTEENPGKPQLGGRLMKRLYDQSSPQMEFLSSK